MPDKLKNLERKIKKFANLVSEDLRLYVEHANKLQRARNEYYALRYPGMFNPVSEITYKFEPKEIPESKPRRNHAQKD